MQKKLYETTMALAFVILMGTNVAKAGGNEGCVIAGLENAPVTIEEFSDFECPYCARGSNTMKQVLKDYAGKVKLVFRNMPLSFHANSLVAAKAFAAVYLQSPSLAYSYQSQIFEHQDLLQNEGESYLFNLADKLGVNLAKMKTDMSGDPVAKIIAEDLQLAESHSFKGTPSFMIGKEAVTGARPYEELKKIIDQQLGK